MINLFIIKLDSAVSFKKIIDRNLLKHGGKAWDGVEQIRMIYSIEAQGMKGKLVHESNCITGQYTDIFEFAGQESVQHFDGVNLYLIQNGDTPVREDGIGPLKAAKSESFRRSLWFWRDDLKDFKNNYLGEKCAADKACDVLSYEAEGGAPFKLFIARDAGLLRKVEESDGQSQFSLWFDEYKLFEGKMIATKMRKEIPEWGMELIASLEEVEFNNKAQFDGVIITKSLSSEVQKTRYEVCKLTSFNKKMFLPVMVNGEGPYNFLLDSCGINVVSKKLVKELDLNQSKYLESMGAGSEKVETILCTDVKFSLKDTSLYCGYVYAIDLTELSQANDIQIDGFLGFEIFRQFDVSIDFPNASVEFATGQAFANAGNKLLECKLKTNSGYPVVDASIDGIKGEFMVDTGSSGNINVFAPVVKKHNLAARYNHPIPVVTGWGLGGATRAMLAWSDGFCLDSHIFQQEVLLELSVDESGVMSSEHLAGNIGNGFLVNFKCVFSASQQTLTLYASEAKQNSLSLTDVDASAMWLHRKNQQICVVDVVPGGPADEAGIRQGDVVLAISDIDCTKLSLPDVRKLVSCAINTDLVEIAIKRGEQQITTLIRLADLTGRKD